MHCLIVDDHQLTAAGMILPLSAAFPDLQISAVRSVKEAIRFIEQHASAPLLVLLDLNLPDQPGTALLQHMRRLPREFPPLCVVISGLGDRSTVDHCRTLGARGYVSKTESWELLEQAISMVRAGGEYFSDRGAEPADDFFKYALSLTGRQRTVLNLIVAGRTNRDIAEELGLTVGTVKNYMHDLMTVFGVKSRLQMAAKARESGYPPQSEIEGSKLEVGKR